MFFLIRAVMNERRIEFAFEGRRYRDLRSRRLFGKLLNGTRRKGHTIALKIQEAQWNNLRNTTSSPDMLNLLDQHYTDYFSHTVKQLDTQFDINWPDNYYFFAIPSKYLELDSKLEQTNGWDGGTLDPLK
ncbi:MAG TPA: RagB/SusD family nutrient uptake outer membrane protein [Chitinophagaceae bacterium]|nr:RagB/SusD family nutrient uptake outer membrane protein [Chitinophagaceae bacterium]